MRGKIFPLKTSYKCTYWLSTSYDKDRTRRENWQTYLSFPKFRSKCVHAYSDVWRKLGKNFKRKMLWVPEHPLWLPELSSDWSVGVVYKGADYMPVWQKKKKYFVKFLLSIQETIKSWKVKMRGLESSDPWKGSELYWVQWCGKRWLISETGLETSGGAQFVPDTCCFPGRNSEPSTPTLSVLSTGLS